MSRLNLNNEDYLNLLFLYNETGKIVSRTCRLFSERYPNRPRPTKDTVNRILNNCKNYGSFKKPFKKTKPVVDNEDNEINTLAFFYSHKDAGLREAEKHLGIPYKSIDRILLKHNWTPYKYHTFQH